MAMVKTMMTWISRVGILLPDGRMKIIQAPDRAGSFNREPYVLHTGDVTGAQRNGARNRNGRGESEISKLYGGKVALVLSVYSALANGLYRWHRSCRK